MKTASSSLSIDNLKMSEEDELLNRKLIKFQDKLDSIIEDEQFHSSWNLSTDSAIWYVRSYINAAYSRSNFYYSKIISDSIYVNAGEYQGAQLNFSDVYDIYSQIISEVSSAYNNLEYEDKELYFLSFDEILEDDDSAYVPILVVFGIDPGSGGPSQWQPFTNGIDWWFGEYYGHCDHSQTGKDAAEEIENFLNLYVPPQYYFPPAPSGYHYINVTDPDNPFTPTNTNYLNPSDPEPYDNEEDCLLYYCTNQNGNITWNNKCLNVDELNFYYYGERQVICDILPEELNKPDDWILLYCDIWGINYGPNMETYHENYLYYARHMLVDNSLWKLEFE